MKKTWQLLLLCALTLGSGCGGGNAGGSGDAGTDDALVDGGEGGETTGTTDTGTGTSGTDPATDSGGAGAAGTLTAGDIDENLNYGTFTQYVNGLLQAANDSSLPSAGVTRRVTLRIVGANQQPIGNARIVVTDAATQEQVISGYAGTDGVFRFFPLLASAQLADSYTVEVSSPETNSPVVTRTLTTADLGMDGEATVALAGQDSEPVPSLDLAFVIDATGSMGDELEYLKTEFSAIIDAVSAQHSGISINYGLVVYRDTGDEFVVRTYEFTSSATTMQQQLNLQAAGGGGDYPEAMDQALAAAYQLQWRTGDTTRLLFLVADAPPHDEALVTTVNTAKDAIRLGIHVHPVAASGVGDVAEYLMRAMAVLTQGRYIFLTDDSGVGTTHQEPSIPCYVVTPLNTLIVRVLNSELSGTREEPAENDIIRSVGSYSRGVCQDAVAQK